MYILFAKTVSGLSGHGVGRYGLLLLIEAPIDEENLVVPVPGQKEGRGLRQNKDDQPLQIQRPYIVRDTRQHINQNQKDKTDRHIDTRDSRSGRLQGDRYAKYDKHTDGPHEAAQD